MTLMRQNIWVTFKLLQGVLQALETQSLCAYAEVTLTFDPKLFLTALTG